MAGGNVESSSIEPETRRTLLTAGLKALEATLNSGFYAEEPLKAVIFPQDGPEVLYVPTLNAEVVTTLKRSRWKSTQSYRVAIPESMRRLRAKLGLPLLMEVDLASISRLANSVTHCQVFEFMTVMGRCGKEPCCRPYRASDSDVNEILGLEDRVARLAFLVNPTLSAERPGHYERATERLSQRTRTTTDVNPVILLKAFVEDHYTKSKLPKAELDKLLRQCCVSEQEKPWFLRLLKQTIDQRAAKEQQKQQIRS